MAGVSTGIGGFVARLMLALRELVLAYQFGATPLLGAFLIAAVLPTYFGQIVAGSLPLVYVPALIRERESAGVQASAGFFATTNAALIGLLAAVAVLMIALFPAYLDVTAGKFSPSERAGAEDLILVLIPFMILRGVNVAWSSALGAEKRFLLPALTPAITPAMTAIVVAVRHDVSAIAWSMTVGMTLETAIVGIAVRRIARLPLWPRLPRRIAPLRTVTRQFFPIVLGSLLFGATTVIDQSMAARVSPGSVAVVYYANLLILFPAVLANAALGTAVLPYASTLASARDWRGLRHTVFVYLRAIALLSVPIAGLVFAFAEPLVRLVFERGAFAAADVVEVAGVTRFLAFQIPFFVGSSVLIQALSALRRSGTLLWASALGFAVKVVLNLALIPQMGLGGIGVATSVMYAASFALMFALLLGELRRRGNGREGG